MPPEPPKTLLDACRYYADPKVTFHTMIAAPGTLPGRTGKRLTYRLLTAQGDAGFMGIK